MAKNIRVSKKYEQFELHPFNRDVMKTRFLEESMLRYGFLSAYPMHVIRGKNGKLLIKGGHHRFMVAKKLGISVKFVVENNDDISIHELERSTNVWKLYDYLISYVKLGYHPYVIVQKYMERTGINLGNAIALLGGESAGSTNKKDAFKDGKYELGDPTHAGIVADIILHCKKCGIEFATNQRFVSAVSRIVWVEDFDVKRMKHKISRFPFLMENKATLDDFTNMLEGVYNRQSQDQWPLSFMAKEKAKQRCQAYFKKKD